MVVVTPAASEDGGICKTQVSGLFLSPLALHSSPTCHEIPVQGGDVASGQSTTRSMFGAILTGVHRWQSPLAC
jgi:hypothetical protein